MIRWSSYDLFKMVTEVHKWYDALLPVEQQDKDEDWFDEIDANMLQFKKNNHGWIRDVERERNAAMEAKSKGSIVSGSVSSKKSSRHSSVSSSVLMSSKSDKDLEWLNYLQKYVPWRREKQQNSRHRS